MKSVGHPDHTYVLIYPGGYGGEFLCYWLGQHSGCIPTPTNFLPNNRYISRFDQIKIHPRAPALKLFLPGHNQVTHAAKNGFVPTDVDQVIGTSVTARYQKFYFLLFALKTLLVKYSTNNMMEHVSLAQHLQFLSVVHPRTDFYYDEFIEWEATQSVPPMNQLLERRFKQSCDHLLERRVRQSYTKVSSEVGRVGVNGAKFCIDLDQLFFGAFVDRVAEYQRLCDHIGTVPDTALLHQLDQYHAKNLDLVSSVTRMPVLDFVELSNKEAWSVIQEVYQRLV